MGSKKRDATLVSVATEGGAAVGTVTAREAPVTHAPKKAKPA